MNIKFKPIDKANYNECIELSVKEKQKKFVAPNMLSLIQSIYEPNLYPLGIYKENKMVGFILYDFDYEINGWSMSRFMIDKKYQNEGIGALALEKFIDFFENKYGQRPIYTSVEVENQVAINLYERFGFKKKEVFEYEAGGKSYKEVRMMFDHRKRK